MFKNYESKPITRRAMKINEDMELLKLDGIHGELRCRYSDGEGFPTQIDFKHHEDVNEGDYIVYLNDDDIYHCSAKVFAERNIIED